MHAGFHTSSENDATRAVLCEYLCDVHHGYCCHQFAVELEGIKDDRQYCTLHIAAKLFFSTTPPSRSVKCGSQTFLKERDVAFSWSVNRLPGSPAMNGIYGSLLY